MSSEEENRLYIEKRKREYETACYRVELKHQLREKGLIVASNISTEELERLATTTSI